MPWVMLIDLESVYIFNIMTQLNKYPKLIFHIIGFILFIFIINGCQDVKEDPDPPGKPNWVVKELPENFIEKGIDVDNTGESRIVLMWYKNAEEDIAGYELFRADTSKLNKYKKITYLDIFHVLGSDTAYYDDSISNYVDYYYFLRAIDNSDNRSIPSDTITYRLIRSPDCIGPVDNLVGQNFTFEWMDRASNYEFSTEYVLRLDWVDSSKTVWTARFTNVWYGYENEEPIPFDFFHCSENGPENLISCNSQITTLTPGIYRWKVKAISEVNNTNNIDEASGESEWAYFEIQ